ncbi:DUF1116 domain-containing protein [Acetonema longum]|uniref:DUF1116 domain-containing protein n=1 Tax=Acetonema longum DSM 6540 TaxID=1009370 RepID=F7NKK2_9FIRM|nr:DUF1116 domain-containing protein [Acetonema longum]EGO63454.1 hypothetical protein ALO_13090 [Acetonema longum DSM 6540]
MTGINRLFGKKIETIHMGTEIFKNDLAAQGVPAVHVDWTPPAGGDVRLLKALDSLAPLEAQIQAANQEAYDRFSSAQPMLTDIQTALDFIPGMTKKTILHSGPPIAWEQMSGPMRGAVMGALIYEGLASDAAGAERMAASGEITYCPCHEKGGVGPMAGIVSASMPVFVLKNITHGNTAFCTLNEGLGKVLRYGAYNQEVVDRLRWIEKILGPALKKAIQLSGGIDMRAMVAQVLHMGDEGHNRNKAGTSLFIRAIAPHLMQAGILQEDLVRVFNFINSNEHFFLNLSMPCCKAALDAANGVPCSTMVTTMARNGTEFGIRVSGLGNRWFTGPAQMIKGLLFPGYTEADANPDIGDSAITETAGIGAFAMAAAPAIVQFVGGTAEDAQAYSNRMYEITIGESKFFSIPQFNFRGSATGIDIRKVIQLGILPQINTGMAHREAGVGQVGAGLVNPPRECFAKALLAFAAEYVK